MPRPRRPARWLLPVAVIGVSVLAACAGSPDAPAPPGTSRGVIDSTIPIAEEVRRFIATVDSVPTRLRHGARSRDELVARFLRAVETRDSLELPRLILQRDEFIGVYYPYTQFTAPPYELSPSLLWFQMQNRSSRGIGRLLDRHGGRALGARDLTCPAPPLEQAGNRIWHGCTMTVVDSAGARRVRRLFGEMLEREGVWKFLSFANDY